jgi:hypothetical protein
MFQYTIEDLARIIQVSKQSIYNFLSKDKAFIKEHSTRRQRKIYYDQEVLKRLSENYGVALEDQTAGEPVEGAQEPTEEVIEEPAPVDCQAVIASLEAEIRALREKLHDREETIRKMEAREQELIKQNGLALLLLQEEKQEKMLLLPDPNKKEKKGFWQRIRGK